MNLDLSNTLEQVKQERASQYGSFYDNMILIKLIREHIEIDVINESLFKDEVFNNTSSSMYKDFNDIKFSIIDFLSNMLALKIVRSFKAKNDAYKDCLVDFVNYVNLTKDAFKNMNLKLIIKFKNPKKGNFHEIIRFINLESDEYLSIEKLNYLINFEGKEFFKNLLDDHKVKILDFIYGKTSF